MRGKKEKIKVYQMTCTSCEKRVEKAIRKLEGVFHVKVSYRGEYAEVEFDDEVCSLDSIKEAIKKAGYSTENSKDYKFIGILIIATTIILFGLKTSGFAMEEKLQMLPMLFFCSGSYFNSLCRHVRCPYAFSKFVQRQ